MTRVLVVEDEPQMLRALAMNLTARGYTVATARNGTAALQAAAADIPDVILLDLGLPDMDGMDVIRAVRGYTRVPIVVLSARNGSPDKVDALDAGADDYVTKPFDANELVARLRAATRRAADTATPTTVRLGPTTINIGARTAEREDAAGVVSRISLTPTEWHMLEVLLSQPNRLISQRQLTAALRGDSEHTDASYPRIYMAQLRRKLEAEPGRPRHLLTEPGMGYRYSP